MARVGQAIQGLVLFSTALGVLFLFEVYSVLPPVAFDVVAFGWVLFAVDSALTFLRPRVSYYLAFVLALLALVETLTQPAHYSVLQGGFTVAAAILVVGSAAQALLLILVPVYVITERSKDPWAWPGAKSQA